MALEKVHFLASSKNRLWRYRCDMLWQAVPKLHTGDQNSTVTDGWLACTSDDENTIIVEPQNLLAGAVHQLVLCHIDKDIKLELDLFRCLQLTWLMEEQSDFVKLRWTELQLDSRIHCQLKPLDDVMGCWWGLRCHSLAMTEQEMPPATGVWVLALIAGCCGVAIALQSRQRWSWQHVIALLSLLAVVPLMLRTLRQIICCISHTFSFCRTMLASGAASAVMRCLSVYVSVTFLHSVKMNERIFKNYSPSGSATILVFPYQTAWQYSDGNPLMGASNAGGLG